MLDTSHSFDQFDTNSNSIQGVVQAIREKIEGSAQPLVVAKAIIEQMIGAAPDLPDVRFARVLAQRIAVLLVEQEHHIVDVHGLVEAAVVYAKKYTTDPNKQWMWVVEDTATATEVSTTIEGVQTQVAVNAVTGKIKKGGKQVLVLELYKKHVLDATPPMTNQEFIQVVMKDLQMSKAGATTYAWTARKELGEPEGGIVKAKKGRKAKEAA